MNSPTLESETEPEYELDIADCYVPNDDDDDDLQEDEEEDVRFIEHTVTTDDHPNIWRVTPQNRQMFERCLRKINYNNFGDVLFSSNVRLYSFVDKNWKQRGVGLLKIVRQLEGGPCHGTARVVAYRRGTLTTIIDHMLEEEMKVGTIFTRYKSDCPWTF